MKCNCKGIACLMLGGENYTIDVNGKRWHFEMHHFIGPATLNAKGDISAHQPGPRAPFWTAVTHWHQQGRQVKDGLCVWTAPPKEKLVHLGGSNYALAGSALAKKFESNADAGQSSPARTT